jgi:HSP20 family protein
MLYYALVFLVVGVIAGALNLAGVSAVAVQISWVLFLIGIVLVAIHVITGRSARDAWLGAVGLSDSVPAWWSDANVKLRYRYGTQEDDPMNADQLKGKWMQFKGELKQKWDKFTDDDLQQIEGSYDRFVGKVQERYGYGDAKRALMKWADAWHQKSAPEAVGKKPRWREAIKKREMDHRIISHYQLRKWSHEHTFTLGPYQQNSMESFQGSGWIGKPVGDDVGHSAGDGWRRQGAMTVAEWSPLVDIIEDEKQFLIRAELPDMKKEQVKLTVENDVLTISGERKYEKETTGHKHHRIERADGSFMRSFSLPENTDGSKMSADYKDGMLTVRLPKSEKAKSKAIEVKVA